MVEPASSELAARWSLRRWLRVVGVVCVSAAVAAIVAGALVLTQLSAARAVLVNQETGVRGFAATGTASFLVPYQQGRRQEDAVLATLCRLGAAKPRPELTTGLDEVLTRARAWRADYAEPTVAAVSAVGPVGATVDPALGKARFDALRAALDRQTAGLTEARTVARGLVDSAANTLLVVCIAIAAGLVVLLVAIGICVRRLITIPVEGLGGEVRAVAAGQFERQVTGRVPASWSSWARTSTACAARS